MHDLQELDPDFIITFGPDVETGHSDPRMISSMTTEINLKERWVEKFPLYYIAWTRRDDEKFKMIGGLNTVDSSYINVSISYTNEVELQALKSIWCNKSSFQLKK